jgi:dynein heavy chain 1
LSAYLQRVEDVLGRGWENHVEGRALKEDGDSFRHKLDAQPLFDKWSADVQQRQLGVSGRIFDIELKHGAAVRLFLSVNFHSQIITLSKEVRNLKWLGFRVPLVIVNKALQANHLYPFAISLKASVRTYQQTLDKLAENESVRPLVANYHKNIQSRIAEGVTLRWESYRLENFVQGLAEDVFTFQEKVDDVLIYNEKLHKLVAAIEKCPLTKKDLSEVLTEIQRVVDHLNLRAYVNLEAWVKTLDAQVEQKLVNRLETAILLWSVALKAYGEKDDDWSAIETGLTDKDINVADLPHIQPLTHEILIRNQVMKRKEKLGKRRRLNQLCP